MAIYPIKMLKDEEGNAFVPLTSSEALKTPDGKTLDEKLQNKLETTNIKAGTDINITVDGNNVTINNASKGVLIDNLTTETPGVGSLDARQGKVLKEMIPEVVNNVTSTDSDKALSAYQGYLLSGKVVPTGGKEGQVLKKSSDTNWSLEWGDAADPNAIVGDGSIRKIVELTYEEYKELEAAGEIDEYTEYHVVDMSENIVIMNREDVQDMIDDATSNYLSLSGGTIETSDGGKINIIANKAPYVQLVKDDVAVSIHIGSGGTNHGLYSDVLKDWIVYSNGTKSFLKGHANDDLSLTGGTLTGNLTLEKSSPVLKIAATDSTTQIINMGSPSYTYNLVTSYVNGSTYGANVNIQCGGSLIIGSGESPSNLTSILGSTRDTEEMYITSDEDIYLESNCQTIANRVGAMISNGGNFLPLKGGTLTNKQGNIGSSSYYWNGSYINSMHATTLDTTGDIRMVKSGEPDFKMRRTDYTGCYRQYVAASNDGEEAFCVGTTGDTPTATIRLRPNCIFSATNGAVTLGLSSNRWGQIYSTSATISTSDRNKRDNIEELDSRYDDLFDRLQPVKYTYKNIDDKIHDRIHTGFISQDVEIAMSDSGLSDKDFAAFCKDQKMDNIIKYNEEGEEIENKSTPMYDEEGNPIYEYSLRYEEFIALNTWQIQKLKKEIQELKEIITELKKEA